MPLIYFVLRLLRVPGVYEVMLPMFHRGVCKILGLKVEVIGQMSQYKPTLFVSNHISYIDIFITGYMLSFFVAKSEVANWPVFGKLAKIQNTLFIERNPKKARQQIEILRTHLSSGNNLTLYPEGTSTNGTYVEPFKSTLFAAAETDKQEPRVAIQAMTVAYTHHADQEIVDQAVRDHYAWYAKMPFLSHFLGLMPLKSARAIIYFHPVCYIDEFENRKACADHCHKVVSQKLDDLVNFTESSS